MMIEDNNTSFTLIKKSYKKTMKEGNLLVEKPLMYNYDIKTNILK